MKNKITVTLLTLTLLGLSAYATSTACTDVKCTSDAKHLAAAKETLTQNVSPMLKAPKAVIVVTNTRTNSRATLADPVSRNDALANKPSNALAPFEVRSSKLPKWLVGPFEQEKPEVSVTVENTPIEVPFTGIMQN